MWAGRQVYFCSITSWDVSDAFVLICKWKRWEHLKIFKSIRNNECWWWSACFSCVIWEHLSTICINFFRLWLDVCLNLDFHSSILYDIDKNTLIRFIKHNSSRYGRVLFLNSFVSQKDTIRISKISHAINTLNALFQLNLVLYMFSVADNTLCSHPTLDWIKL